MTETNWDWKGIQCISKVFNTINVGLYMRFSLSEGVRQLTYDGSPKKKKLRRVTFLSKNERNWNIYLTPYAGSTERKFCVWITRPLRRAYQIRFIHPKIHSHSLVWSYRSSETILFQYSYHVGSYVGSSVHSCTAYPRKYNLRTFQYWDSIARIHRST